MDVGREVVSREGVGREVVVVERREVVVGEYIKQEIA